MAHNVQGYNGYVDGSAFGYPPSDSHQMPVVWPVAYQHPMQYYQHSPPVPLYRGGRARGSRRPRGMSNVRGGSGRGGSRTWINPNINPDAYKKRTNHLSSQSVPEATTSHNASQGNGARRGRGAANKVLVNKATSVKPTPSSSHSQQLTPGQRLTIHGARFIVSKSGKKLIRSKSSKTETPVQVIHGGQEYLRTKSGNLIAKSIIRPVPSTSKDKHNTSNSELSGTPSRNRKKDTLCRYFQKTGECRNARTCRYVHDSSKIAICPRFLRNACENTEATCALSHSPNEHRMPHCSHFPNCTFGDRCMFPHVHTTPGAGVCRDFAVFGWCDAGASKCAYRHVNECPEFSEKGSCSQGRSCKLPHVLRRKRDPNATEVTMPSVPKREKRTIDQTREEIPITAAANDEEQQQEESDTDSDLDTARVKRSKHDHIDPNTDYVTFFEEQSDDDEQDDGEDDDAASVDSAQFSDHNEGPAEDEDSEPSSSENEDSPKETGEDDPDQTFVTAQRGSSEAPSDHDDFDAEALMH